MPQFSDIIGHTQIKNHLQSAIAMDKVSHAYILNGPQDSGKMMLAEAFAKSLLCEAGGDCACGQCRSCRQVEDHNHPDLIYVSHEKPNSIRVDDIRDQLNGDIVIKPYAGGRKIYIVDQAELMNAQAQNALLKTIEEPPAYAVIMLLTANADSFLQTIRSRCVQLNLKTVKSAAIRKYLMENYEIPDYQAELAATFAQGNVGRAIKLACSDDFGQQRDDALSLLKKVRETELCNLPDLIKQVSEYKDSIYDYLDLCRFWYRDLLLLKSTGETKDLIYQDQIFELKKQAEDLSYRQLEQRLEAIDLAGLRLNANVNFDLTIEMLLRTMHG